ncbi:MAG: right-handed parallel beta-helix repeat-containing protein [Vicinamibacterales bacterium]
MHVAGGTYDYAGSLSGEATPRFAVLYNPVNSGEAGNPLTFYATSTVTLTAGNLAAPVIGASGVDYVRWWGPFFVDETTCLQTPDTGPVVLANTTGSMVRGCRIQGIWVDYNDNNPGVRLENASNCTVSYNTIDGFRKSQVDGSPNHNGCGIQLYACVDCLVERNTITDCHSGVFFKDLNGTGLQSGVLVATTASMAATRGSPTPRCRPARPGARTPSCRT